MLTIVFTLLAKNDRQGHGVMLYGWKKCGLFQHGVRAVARLFTVGGLSPVIQAKQLFAHQPRLLQHKFCVLCVLRSAPMGLTDYDVVARCSQKVSGCSFAFGCSW